MRLRIAHRGPHQPATPQPPQYAHPPTARFHASRVYVDPLRAHTFKRFFDNVLSLYPRGTLHRLMGEIVNSDPAQPIEDLAAFQTLVARLPENKPGLLEKIKLALATLRRQKQVLATQTAALLDPDRVYDGYLEVGTMGDYIRPLRALPNARIQGPVWLATFTEPTYAPTHVMQRGGITQPGTFIPLHNYAPIDPATVPDASVDLVTVYIGLHHIPQDRIEPFIRSLFRVLRPGGTLILRDHDQNTANDDYLHLAHTTFNAGTGVSLEGEATEFRNFHPLDYWVAQMASAGFEAGTTRLAQSGDPTDNLLMRFTKPVRTLEEIRAHVRKTTGYAVSENQTDHRVAEWDQVFRAQEYADFLARQPSYTFPFWHSIAQYARINWLATKYGKWNPEMIMMNAVIAPLFMMELAFQSLLERTLVRTDHTDPDIARYAEEYSQLIPFAPWYQFDFATRLQAFNQSHPEWSGEKVVFNLMYGAKAFLGRIIGKLAGGTPPSIGMLIYDPEQHLETAMAGSHHAAHVTVVREWGQGIRQITVPQLQAFTELIPEIVRHGIRIEDIAGNVQINLAVTLPPGAALPTDLPETTERYRYPTLTKPGQQTVILHTTIHRLGDVVAALDAGKVPILHVYDF